MRREVHCAELGDDRRRRRRTAARHADAPDATARRRQRRADQLVHGQRGSRAVGAPPAAGNDLRRGGRQVGGLPDVVDDRVLYTAPRRPRAREARACASGRHPETDADSAISRPAQLHTDRAPEHALPSLLSPPERGMSRPVSCRLESLWLSCGCARGRRGIVARRSALGSGRRGHRRGTTRRLSSARTARRGVRRRQGRAFALAEAGVNNSMAVLNHPTNNALKQPTLVSCAGCRTTWNRPTTRAGTYAGAGRSTRARPTGTLDSRPASRTRTARRRVERT